MNEHAKESEMRFSEPFKNPDGTIDWTGIALLGLSVVIMAFAASITP